MPQSTQPPPGYDSVHAVKDDTEAPSAFEEDEWVVYNVAQQRIKYVVDLAPCANADSKQAKPIATAAPQRAGSTKDRSSFRRSAAHVGRPHSGQHSISDATNGKPATTTAATTRSSRRAPPPVSIVPVVPLHGPQGPALGRRRPKFNNVEWRRPFMTTTALAIGFDTESVRQLFDMHKLQPKHTGSHKPLAIVLNPFVQPRQMEEAEAVLGDLADVLAPLSIKLGEADAAVDAQQVQRQQQLTYLATINVNDKDNEQLVDFLLQLAEAYDVDAVAESGILSVALPLEMTLKDPATKRDMPLTATVASLHLLQRESINDRWRVIHSATLGTSPAERSHSHESNHTHSAATNVPRPANWQLDMEATEGQEGDEEDNATDAL